MSEKKAAPKNIDFTWHLAADEPEVAATEFEFALMRSGPDNALLHVIRMNDRAKTIKEIARLMNRDDIPNIQYSIRKMVSDGLVSKHGSSRTGVTYAATDRGCEITDRNAEVRRRQWISEISE